MPFDQHKNLAVAAVVVPPSPAESGTTITVPSGEGARFPVAPFTATVWASTELPTPVSAELVRVISIAGDTFAIVRAQEGSTARPIVAGDLFAATITAKTLTDIEGGQNFADIGFATNAMIRRATVDGADNGSIQFCGGGGNTPDRGAMVNAIGNEYPDIGGSLMLMAGNAPTAQITFLTGYGHTRGVIHPSGGLSWGTLVDPGADNIKAAGTVSANAFKGTATSGATVLSTDTVDGADTKAFSISGGGNTGNERGACVNLYGNEANGILDLIIGDVPSAGLNFYTGPGYTRRGKIYPSGGFAWSTTDADPGAGSMLFGNAPGVNSTFTMIMPGVIHVGNAGNALTTAAWFINANGYVGYIQTSGSTCTYNTSSDARLKDDRGPLVVSDVLRRTVVHAFTWKDDGTPGRGVFAQEAIAVAPFAVAEGTDERDEHGRLKHPWGVDYSKYVPDLIVGWQTHDAQVASLQAEVSALTARVAMMSTRPIGRPSLFARVRDRIASWFAGGSPVTLPNPQFSKGL